MSGPLLSVESISLAFGGLKAVNAFSLSLGRRQLWGLIGPNGAGKTTAFNLLTGVYRPDSGTVSLEGRRLNGLPPHEITAAGLARTFQNIRLFPDLSVLDNVRVACHLDARHGLLAALLRTPRHLAEEKAMEERSRALLSLFGLEERADGDARKPPTATSGGWRWRGRWRPRRRSSSSTSRPPA